MTCHFFVLRICVKMTKKHLIHLMFVLLDAAISSVCNYLQRQSGINPGATGVNFYPILWVRFTVSEQPLCDYSDIGNVQASPSATGVFLMKALILAPICNNVNLSFCPINSNSQLFQVQILLSNSILLLNKLLPVITIFTSEYLHFKI